MTRPPSPVPAYLQDSDFTLYQGDALEVLRTLPDESVHMCVTSPPFYGLRDYGTGTWEGGDAECDHIPPQPEPIAYDNGQGESYTTNNQNWNKKGRTYQGDTCGKCGATRIDQQIGLEETPEQWVQKLVEVFREVRRVLRKDGTLWLEVGDSYGANQGKGFNTQAENGYAEVGRNRIDLSTPIKHPYKPKDLIGAPWLLAFALRADGWYLRSDIVWSRPNPMPESVTDRPTKSHSYVFLLSKSARYFFDQEAVREVTGREASWDEWANGDGRTAPSGDLERGKVAGFGGKKDSFTHPSGRNIRSVWTIPTQPYPEAHFATYPEELVRRCILAGTSERGCCPECGAPWVREVETTYEKGGTGGPAGERHAPSSGSPIRVRLTRNDTTLGWHPSCDGHWRGNPIPCTVLDPFSGSGTTALVARKRGRKCIGIELSADYCALSARRLQQLSLLSEAGA